MVPRGTCGSRPTSLYTLRPTSGVLRGESSTTIQCRLATCRKVLARRVGVTTCSDVSASDHGGGRLYTYSVRTTSTMPRPPGPVGPAAPPRAEQGSEEEEEGLLERLSSSRPFRILGGSMHYFRVPRAYWRDRLMKTKACGINTVTTWLLRDGNMRVRTTYPGFTHAVNVFFDKLIPKIVPLQFKKGGPIIAVQLDDGYGSFAKDDGYMAFIKEALTSRGVSELLITSDHRNGLRAGGVNGAPASLCGCATPTPAGTTAEDEEDEEEEEVEEEEEREEEEEGGVGGEGGRGEGGGRGGEGGGGVGVGGGGGGRGG
ncbi:hypothetical protein CRUP_001692 [Coryphaenoides rupestris]|nr:hypothetical protein CRUP_001692 [Coryphaenoides rupestris]